MNISVQKIQTGDELAFKEFFNEFYQALCVFANSYVLDNALAADIVQETFVKVWSRKQNFDSILKMRSFLYVTVRNSCLNKIRDKKTERVHLSEADNLIFFQDTLIENEAYRMLYKAIESLPAQSRKIIELALEGKKNAEIAENMGIQMNSVLTLKKLAYRKLKIILGEHYYILFYILSKNTNR